MESKNLHKVKMRVLFGALEAMKGIEFQKRKLPENGGECLEVLYQRT
jgi:hypothetical protein